MWTARDNRFFLPVFVGLVALAWFSLVIWDQSPYGRYLSHDALDEIEFGSNATLLLVFVAGWTLMTVAMMLPTSLPLIALFRRMTGRRADGHWLVGLLITGYLTVWTLFGFVVHLADLGVHWTIGESAAFERNAWALGAGTLILAGLYQFTSLKYHCLDQCRSPLSFIAGHWSGRDHRRQAFILGLHHGLFCVGCCWSLMLLMFAVGVGNLAWMFLLGAVMAVEKNLPWGRQLSAPLGVALIAMGAGLTLLAIA